MKMWGGRFGDGPDARMADFTRSIEVDVRVVEAETKDPASPASGDASKDEGEPSGE